MAEKESGGGPRDPKAPVTTVRRRPAGGMSARPTEAPGGIPPETPPVDGPPPVVPNPNPSDRGSFLGRLNSALLTEKAMLTGLGDIGDRFRRAVGRFGRPVPEIPLTDPIFSHIEIGRRAADAAHVQRVRDRLAESQEQRADGTLATLVEAVLCRQIESADWFGENAKSFQTTEFDDRFHHTDAVVEWQRKDGSVRLAIDFTTSVVPNEIAKKESYIEDELKSGTLTTIDYYLSEQEDGTEIPQSLTLVPRVILGLSAFRANDLAVEAENRAMTNQMMSEHPLQLVFLRQAEAQLGTQLQYLLDLALRERSDKVVPQAIQEVIARFRAQGRAFGNPGDRAAQSRYLVELQQAIAETLSSHPGTFRNGKFLPALREMVRTFGVVHEVLEEKLGNTVTNGPAVTRWERSELHRRLTDIPV